MRDTNRRSHRLRALVTASAIVVGLVGFFVTVFAWLALSVSPECDGPCFGEKAFYVCIAVGVACGFATAWIVWERLTRGPKDG
jgi:uncharacterized membrane protein